jgi:hypothetical protein
MNYVSIAARNELFVDTSRISIIDIDVDAALVRYRKNRCTGPVPVLMQFLWTA